MIEYNNMTREQKQVKALETLVTRILSNHHMYKLLCSYEEHTKILSKTAPFFFFETLFDLLQREFFLESAKILEDKKTFGKQNLSVKHFIEMDGTNWTEEQKKKFKDYDEKLFQFRDCIKDARNKIISHNDLYTYEAEDSEGLSAFAEGLDDKFVKTLEDFYNYLHEITFGEIWGRFTPNVEAGGIQELIAFLYQGLAFEDIVNDEKTSPKFKMLLIEKNLELKGV